MQEKTRDVYKVVSFLIFREAGLLRDIVILAFGWKKKLIAKKGKTYKRILSPTFYICQKYQSRTLKLLLISNNTVIFFSTGATPQYPSDVISRKRNQWPYLVLLEGVVNK